MDTKLSEKHMEAPGALPGPVLASDWNPCPQDVGPGPQEVLRGRLLPLRLLSAE